MGVTSDRPSVLRVLLFALLAGALLGPPIEAQTGHLRGTTGGSDGSNSPVAPLLWRVDGTGRTVFLYGSIHIAPPEVIPPPVVVREAFDQSELLVTEIPIEDGLSVQLQTALAARMFLADGATLETALAQDDWVLVQEWGEANHIPQDTLRTMQPWAVELLINETELAPSRFSAEYGLDTYFAQKAVARGMRSEALETASDQLDILAGGSFDEQVDSLIATLTSPGAQDETERLYETWRRGDTASLARLVEEGLSTAPPAAYDRLLTRRNERWVTHLQAMLHESGRPAFVVIGAAHLVGRSNVLSLLERRGYSPVRVLEITDLESTANR